MKVQPIKNSILFQFIDGVNASGQFEKQKTDAGLWLQGTVDDSAKSARWATVVAIGPDVKNINIGEQILIPALRWTEGAKYDNQRVWRTNADEVVVTRKSEKSPLNVLTHRIIFVREKQKIHKRGMLFVISEEQHSTIPGTVVYKGPEVCEELNIGCKIYFNDTNFFDTFKHLNVEFSFIKDTEVFAYEPHED